MPFLIRKYNHNFGNKSHYTFSKIHKLAWLDNQTPLYLPIMYRQYLESLPDTEVLSTNSKEIVDSHQKQEVGKTDTLDTEQEVRKDTISYNYYFNLTGLWL